MTNMNPNEGFAHFGIVTAAVCLPTYFLIGIINQPDQFERTVAFVAYPLVWLPTGFKHGSDRAKKYRETYIHRTEEEPKPELTRANMMASLDFRRSREMSRDRMLSIAGLGTEEMVELPKTENVNGHARPSLPERASTIRFEVPTYRPSEGAPEDVPEPSPNTSVLELDRTMTEPVQSRITVQQRVERTRDGRSHSAPTRTLLRRLTSQGEGGVQKSLV